MYTVPMDKLFNPDNPVMIALSRCFDLIVANICFVIASIPLFTIGPSLSALYSVTLKMAEGDSGNTILRFRNSFRENFRQGVTLWLILLGLAAFLFGDLYVIFFILPPEYRLLQFPVWLLLFPVLSAVIYAFPLLARYEQSNLTLIKNSILLSLGNIPLTISVIVLMGVIIDISLHNGGFLVLFFSIFLFIGCALLARIFSAFFIRIFRTADERSAEDPDSSHKG